MTPNRMPAIKALATAVFDTGRRGMPRPGCDCEQCFGYCLVNTTEAERAGFKNTMKREDDE